MTISRLTRYVALALLLACNVGLSAQVVNFDRFQTKDGSYTTQQTGVALWTPSAAARVVVTVVDIQCGGTTAGTVQLWFGASNDTSFTQGTDQPVTYMDCSTPSATFTPGKVIAQANIISLRPDYILRVTTNAALTVRVIVHGYEI